MRFAAIDKPFQQLQMKKEIGKAKFINFFYTDATLKLHRNLYEFIKNWH
jgi:hypothetical protein